MLSIMQSTSIKDDQEEYNDLGDRFKFDFSRYTIKTASGLSTRRFPVRQPVTVDPSSSVGAQVLLQNITEPNSASQNIPIVKATNT